MTKIPRLKVEKGILNLYDVVEYIRDDNEINWRNVLFNGSITDCKSYLDLKEKGYLD